MPDSNPDQPKPNGSSPEAQAGHTVQVQQLFIKHQTNIKAFILSLQPNFSEAEDILQEVFLVITRKAPEFAIGSNFLAWALSIARFKVLEYFRARKSSPRHLSSEVLETLCQEAPPEWGHVQLQVKAVQRCLDQLAPRTQEVIRMRYYGEKGPNEIARCLHWSPNSVNVALSRARRFLQKCVTRQVQRA